MHPLISRAFRLWNFKNSIILCHLITTSLLSWIFLEEYFVSRRLSHLYSETDLYSAASNNLLVILLRLLLGTLCLLAAITANWPARIFASWDRFLPSATLWVLDGASYLTWCLYLIPINWLGGGPVLQSHARPFSFLIQNDPWGLMSVNLSSLLAQCGLSTFSFVLARIGYKKWTWRWILVPIFLPTLIRLYIEYAPSRSHCEPIDGRNLLGGYYSRAKEICSKLDYPIKDICLARDGKGIRTVAGLFTYSAYISVDREAAIDLSPDHFATLLYHRIVLLHTHSSLHHFLIDRALDVFRLLSYYALWRDPFIPGQFGFPLLSASLFGNYVIGELTVHPAELLALFAHNIVRRAAILKADSVIAASGNAESLISALISGRYGKAGFHQSILFEYLLAGEPAPRDRFSFIRSLDKH